MKWDKNKNKLKRCKGLETKKLYDKDIKRP
jgi:hypothetical protein